MTSPAIEAVNLSKVFFDRARGDIQALDNLSFRCERGEVVGLLGPNGAGKSTALRLVAGLLEPSGGSVRLAGYNPLRQPVEARKALGYITGNTQLYGRMTPVEILGFFGGLHGMTDDRIARRTEEVVEAFDLRDFARSPCARLSTGQKQRVNLARAVLHEPSVLLLDEPMSSLDVLTTRTVSDYVRQARAEGRCIVFSTHNIAEAELLCDRILVLHRGSILAFDRLENLLASTGQANLTQVLLKLLEAHEPVTL